MLRILLVVSRVQAGLPSDPSSWETYGKWKQVPPFPPPETGPSPLYIPIGYFEDYPFLTRAQLKYIQRQYSKEYSTGPRVSVTFSIPRLFLAPVTLL